MTSLPRRLPLQDMALAPASLHAYNTNLSSFLTHARLPYSTFLSARASLLDRRLAQFIQHLYDAGRPFVYASHALHAAVFHRPALRACLHVSRQCPRGWERVKRSRSHPPLTWELTVLLATTLLRSGHHAAAVAMLVAFDCYLRVGELTRLRRCDIVLPHDARMGRAFTGMAVCLPHTKTGPNQSVPLQSQTVADILCMWVRAAPASTPATARVFPFSPSRLRQLMHNACAAHGLSATPYVPHSLRHGGATADFLRTNSIEHVQFRGRWKCMESARRYIQASRALLAAQQVPQSLHDLGALLSDTLLSNFAHVLTSASQETTRPPGRRVTFNL
jgi:integrase